MEKVYHLSNKMKQNCAGRRKMCFFETCQPANKWSIKLKRCQRCAMLIKERIGKERKNVNLSPERRLAYQPYLSSYLSAWSMTGVRSGLFSASDVLRFLSFPSLSGQKEPVGQSGAVVPRALSEAAEPPEKLSASVVMCTDIDDVCNRNWNRMLLDHCWNNVTQPSKLQITVLCAGAGGDCSLVEGSLESSNLSLHCLA